METPVETVGMEGVYRRALYRVDAEEVFVLRIGQFSDALKALFDSQKCQSAAFLTAFNPGGVKTSDTYNNRAQNELENHLEHSGIEAIAGIGLDSDRESQWPGEPSVLALSIKRTQAIEIANKFGQLAILWCPSSAIPELLMIDSKRRP